MENRKNVKNVSSKQNEKQNQKTSVRKPRKTSTKTANHNRPPQRKKRKKYVLHYLLLFAFCIGLGLTVCFTLLFKVGSIQVKNNSYSHYSDEEIISRSGIVKEESLLQISAGDTEKMLLDRFPYLESVKVKRRLPSTVIIDIKEETEIAAAYTDEGYSVISATGKVLSTKLGKAPDDIPVLFGIEDETFRIGDYLYKLQKDDGGKKSKVIIEKVQKLQDFLKIAESLNFGNLTYIDISDNGEIKALYDKRILINFGGEIDLDKKIMFVQKVLQDGIAENHKNSGYTNENFEGTIDITNRKQLRTRAVAIKSIQDERAYAVFEDEEIYFEAEDEFEEIEEVTDEILEENAEQDSQNEESSSEE